MILNFFQRSRISGVITLWNKSNTQLISVCSAVYTNSITKVKYWVFWETICNYILFFCWHQLTFSCRLLGKTDLGFSCLPKVKHFEVFGEAVCNFILVFCWQYLYFTPFPRFSTSKISVKWPWLSKVNKSWLFGTFCRDHIRLYYINLLMTPTLFCTVFRYFNPCRKLSIPDSLDHNPDVTIHLRT